MARSFMRLTRSAMRGLRRGEVLREHGIVFERCGDGDGIFSVNIMVDGQRIHRVIGRESEGSTRTQAEDYIERARQDSKSGRLSLPKGRKATLSFADAAKRYVEALAGNDGKDLKEKRWRLALHLVPFFGQMPLSSIDSLAVDRYKEKRRNEPSRRGGIRRGKRAQSSPVAASARPATKATINRELAVLSHLLSRAVEWGWIATTPAKIRRFRESPTRFEYLTEDEIGRTLGAAAEDSHPQIYAFITIALRSAMRLGEVLSLRREQIDFGRSVIHLPKAKTGARDVPMSGSLRNFLEGHLQALADDDPWLFPSSSAKSGHTETIVKPWKRVVKAAGLADRRITPHTLRHTAITHLVQAGVDICQPSSVCLVTKPCRWCSGTLTKISSMCRLPWTSLMAESERLRIRADQ